VYSSCTLLCFYPSETHLRIRQNSYYFRQDLELWQHDRSYDPHLWLEPWQRRNEQGKALREKTPRETHADWPPPVNRPNPLDMIIVK
jgi:hypothetical protein